MVPEAIAPVGPERPGQHAGFLGAAFDPYRVNSDPNLPDYSPGPLRPDQDLSRPRLAGRRGLLARLSQQAQYLDETSAARTLDPYYERAFDLISAPRAQKAFDISAESDKTRDRYGRHVFGQSVLLARRLIEAGVRLVHVNWVRHDNGKGGQGYDSHRDHLNWAKTELLPPTDAAFAALVEDLADRGLLDETVIVMMGEFGPTASAPSWRAAASAAARSTALPTPSAPTRPPTPSAPRNCSPPSTTASASIPTPPFTTCRIAPIPSSRPSRSRD
jgi:hypothetical protein